MKEDLSPAILERAMLTAWPSLMVAYDGGWVIRISAGHTKRANSVSCLMPDAEDLDHRLDRIEAHYHRHALKPIFRVSPVTPSIIDETLAKRGWKIADPSIVMVRDLEGASLELAHSVERHPVASDEWLAAYNAATGYKRSSLSSLRKVSTIILPEHSFFLAADENGKPAATTLAVCDGPLVGLFEVATLEQFRNQGYAKSVVCAATTWGRSAGAQVAWLQVADDNEPAIALYRSLGFTEAYRYHYRMP